MRINTKEREILSLISLDAEKPLKEIQSETGYKSHTIRYYIQQLKEKNVIKYIPFIDVYPLGYIDIALYFSLNTHNSTKEFTIIDELINSPNVSWLAKIGGDYEFASAIYVKHIDEFVQFIDNLNEKFGALFFKKSIHIRSEFRYYNHKYLSTDIIPKEIIFGGKHTEIKIDNLDHKILHGISSIPFNSHRNLAHSLQIPLSTLEYRIKNLKKSNIIKGYTYSIDASSINMQTYECLIYTKGINKHFKERFFKYCLQHPHIIYSLYGIGEWDFEIALQLDNQEKASEIIRNIYTEFGDDILTIKLLPMFKWLKLSYYPFT